MHLAARTRPDNRAFATLVREHDATLRSLAYRLLGDRHRMDDVLQDAYVKAYRALPAFRGEASPKTWLYRIVYNACLDELRKTRRRRVRELPEFPEHAVSSEGPLDQVELRASLGAALAQLPADQRAVVLLVDGEGFDYNAAADVLGIAPGTVASRLSRARSSLRLALDDLRGGGARP